MNACSVLFPDPAAASAAPDSRVPECFADLHLDRIVAAITAGREIYGLRPWFYRPLTDPDAVVYRQEVMRDLEQASLVSAINGFARAMDRLRERRALADKLRNELQRQRWFLDAAAGYCSAVTQLAADLARAALRSRALAGFRDSLQDYIRSTAFTALRDETDALCSRLAAIRYRIFVDGLTVDIGPDEEDADYGSELQTTFAPFRQDAGGTHRFEFAESPQMDHVESSVLEQVARLHAGTFAALETFCAAHADFADPNVLAFDREIQFYLAYLDYLAPLKRTGLAFCYPSVATTGPEVFAEDAFDLALATKLAAENSRPVCNDFHLRGEERLLVVSGPNQGGKTTFARSFGQLHFLANLGCPVPGRRAQLLLFDRLSTHFEKAEKAVDLRGKLQDDLLRIRSMLETATPRSILILNEIFTSTTLRDALVLSKRIARRLLDSGAIGVWVTFLDELSALSPQTVSMVGTVAPDNPARRTYKILRQRPDGLAYALTIAEKYRLTYAQLVERLGS